MSGNYLSLSPSEFKINNIQVRYTISMGRFRCLKGLDFYATRSPNRADHEVRHHL